MKLFSQREGLTPTRTILQINSMDNALRSRLWDEVTRNYWSSVRANMLANPDNRVIQVFLERLWHEFFKEPIDTIPTVWDIALSKVRTYFFTCYWNQVYDFLEFAIMRFPSESSNHHLIAPCNIILQEEMSGYRIIGSRVTPISSGQEVQSVEESLALQGKLEPIRRHIDQSVSLLSDRKHPDYRNSIKEAICAVEAMCQIIGESPKATLGDAIKELESKVPIHPALRAAFEKLYGYTSDAEGIRHALIDEPSLGFEDAKYMLVSCSAFVNYIIAKSAKAEIDL